MDQSPSVEQLSSFYSPKSVKLLVESFGIENKDGLSEICERLSTHKTSGIDSDSVSSRIEKYGRNALPEHVPKTFWQLVYDAFNDKTMLLLSAAAVVSFLLGLYQYFFQPPQYDPEGNKIPKVDWIEGVAIMMAVVVVVFVSAINDYQKELQFMKLNQKKENGKRIKIVRNNGSAMMLPNHDLVVGDIVELATGDVLPADCILITGECDVDESALTGESDTIKKFPLEQALSYFFTTAKSKSTNVVDDKHFPDPILISGSKIIAGLGTALVTAVGVNSVYGRTMVTLTSRTNSIEDNENGFEEDEEQTTPLQERLSKLTDRISVYGCIVAMLLFLVLFFKFLYGIFSKNGFFRDLPPTAKGNKFLNIFITAITIIVVAVPEGLPLAVTLALAFATTRMTQEGNLVRVLKSCETMGSATAICSDKTGTLTENIMTVTDAVVGGETVKNINDFSETLERYLIANITLNSTAFENNDYIDPQSTENPFNKNKNSTNDEPNVAPTNTKEMFIGSKTETALLTFAKKYLNLNRLGKLQTLRNDPSSKFPTIISIPQIISFESSRKWSGIVIKVHDDKTNKQLFRFYIKGAAEIVLKCCTHETLADGSTCAIDDKTSKKISNTVKTFANEALRAISLAHVDFHDVTKWPPKDLVDRLHSPDAKEASPELIFKQLIDSRLNSNGCGLTLDGIFGIKDPLREGVDQSVLQCQNSGIVVRMVTGDNLMTAKAIARNCNILTDEQATNPEYAMEGATFRKMSNEERRRILPHLRVMARCSPEDKRILVGTLKSMGEIVAVTGDGTNDAPALKLADVGFSMGIAGTEVAREASDIILTTDDFASIVSAIKWGRCVSLSIKKFIQFQLTVNITAVVLTFVSAVLSQEENSVLTAVQLLWVNLIMDTLAALALATDKPDENIMNKKPLGRDAALISFSSWKMIIAQSILQLIVTFILHFNGQAIFYGDQDDVSGKDQQRLDTLTFNTFVWLQFFTLLVSRKLDEADGITTWRGRCTLSNLNFFQHLFRNYYFIAILLLIGILQILIVLFGGVAFSIEAQTKEMWFTAVLCGMLSLPMGILVRLCPDEVIITIFPERVVEKIRYVIGLEFLTMFQENDDKSEDEESLLQNEQSTSYGTN
ncbi:hypothetical protein TPHA_0F00800 [Tetrapisispora phaffii CBS 4417]|uniref:Calcium-transporting ATPase n=1 Tax=Tetrapisispora phaffii (strain ATCC 24235 / CBS 4417 / NBRC 1672 / NRRL Y-8282 / UCD 70-5) TaxID=1071381 RepID=G8BUY4_TETPH|nr:hypothetical protein TPHA_0F00800 [Tetrapisispora phaffii CBS 4417]CCE63566.1 hypothetical protein TPHA_0F00800 [Tetrapisispora phaffii CBS 4417]